MFAIDSRHRFLRTGTKDLKKALIAQAAGEVDQSAEAGRKASQRQVTKVPRYDGDELRGANELRSELALEQCLRVLGKSNQDCEQTIKPAEFNHLVANRTT